jgi:bacterioferritin-associated ferredoxin
MTATASACEGMHLTIIIIIDDNRQAIFFQGVAMYVCICRAVTDKQIREAAHQGLRTVKALKECMGLADECAKCARCAQQILRECHGCNDPEAGSMQQAA